MHARQSARTARLEARIAPQILSVVQRAAEIQGRSLSDFVVAAVHEAANRAIAETEVIRLSVEGQRQLAKLLMDPPAPGRALKKAVRRRRELFGIK
jgi:uncharacterized protein (DUF1778 family)